uniref:Uncharacterized protein n=1 Tax=Rhizophagus irregularis (strain DAOM 181602 / DAOM 197198 / MUCL 43194) TaxID=747089 RepID=U9TI90_RHIID
MIVIIRYSNNRDFNDLITECNTNFTDLGLIINSTSLIKKPTLRALPKLNKYNIG